MTDAIPFSRPSIGEEEIAEVVACLRSGWITSGPRTAQFEREFTAAHELTDYRARLGDLRAALPVATDASARLFSLPLYPGLSDP